MNLAAKFARFVYKSIIQPARCSFLPTNNHLPWLHNSALQLQGHDFDQEVRDILNLDFRYRIIPGNWYTKTIPVDQEAHSMPALYRRLNNNQHFLHCVLHQQGNENQNFLQGTVPGIYYTDAKNVYLGKPEN